jgi:dolichol-phosphate mannosyltransferase
MKLNVLLLVHNEEKTIKDDVLKIIKFIKEKNYKIIIAEDGSTDNTVSIIKKISKKKIILISSKKKIGYKKSFLKAMKLVNSDYVMQCESGSKFNYKKINMFYKIIRKNNLDLVSGIRIERKDYIYRRILTKGLEFLYNLYFNLNYHDYDCGFRIYKTKSLKSVLKNKLVFDNLISSEIFLKFVFNKNKIKQINIKYLNKKTRKSRGLPLKKIIRVIVEIMLKLKKLNEKK